MDNLEGKIALVTGASSGIGAAIAGELSKRGLKVIGLARRIEKVEEIKKTFANAKGNIYAYKGDVSKKEDIEGLFQWIEVKFGTLDYLINNAGIARNGLFTEIDADHLTDVINVNLVGLLHCSQKAINLMIKRNSGNGQIININSVAGHTTPNYPPVNVYPATKHAVVAASETIRQTLRHIKANIKVSNICPGIVKTEIGEASALAVEGTIAGSVSRRYEHLPHLHVEDVVSAVMYILTAPEHLQVHDVIMRHLMDPY